MGKITTLNLGESCKVKGLFLVKSPNPPIDPYYPFRIVGVEETLVLVTLNNVDIWGVKPKNIVLSPSYA